MRSVTPGAGTAMPVKTKKPPAKCRELGWQFPAATLFTLYRGLCNTADGGANNGQDTGNGIYGFRQLLRDANHCRTNGGQDEPYLSHLFEERGRRCCEPFENFHDVWF